MRKKIIYFSFLFFALGFCFSQNTSIEYLVEKNGMRQLFTLDITGNKSLFYSNEYCNPEEMEIFNYVVIENAEKGNYIFHDQIEILRVYYKQEITLKWKITKDTKVVDNIVLNKATTAARPKSLFTFIFIFLLVGVKL